MVLASILGKVARRSKAHAARKIGGHENKHLTFLHRQAIPELYTLIAAPDQLRTTRVRVHYDPYRDRLNITFNQEHTTKFIFREDDILVLSPEPFNKEEYRETLRKVLRNT